jgi:hypothetical protein
MKTTMNLKQRTRKDARLSANEFRNSGYDAKVIDNGSYLKNFDRWCVCITIQRETLTVSRKPKGNTFTGMRKETCHNAVKWLKDRPTKVIPVYVKTKHLSKCSHV